MTTFELYRALNEIADTLDYAQTRMVEIKNAERALRVADDIIEEVYGSVRELAQKVKHGEITNA